MASDKSSALSARIDSFPTLPTVVTRVMEVTANSESSAGDLMRVISPDQSLTATILKMANSAFFGLTRKISSLPHALTVLGFTEIRNLVLAKAVFNSFKNLKDTDSFGISNFWEHSFLCGLAAKIIAKDLRASSNEFFVAGIIHDIGKLVIYMALPMEFSKIVQGTGSPNLRTFQAEESVLGVTHDKVGIKLLKRWMFPESLITAVGFHHRPHEAEKESLFPIVIHLADLLSHSDQSFDEEEYNPSINEELLDPEIVGLAQSHGLIWNESALERCRHELAKLKEEEAATLHLLLS
jgi:HD-like signal output (HDOD) protein